MTDREKLLVSLLAEPDAPGAGLSVLDVMDMLSVIEADRIEPVPTFA